MKVALLDCLGGASGNMMLGALVDAGVAPLELADLLGGLGLPDWSLRCDKVTKRGIAATHVVVESTEPAIERHLSDIEALIVSSDLEDGIQKRSLAVFQRLAEAEARVHDVPIEQIHFHEVGAVDAIVDIVGTVAGLSLLGVGDIFCGALPMGRGVIECAHGTFPDPAPATVELVRNCPLRITDLGAELVTPTGAALLTTLANFSAPTRLLAVDGIGYGAGTRDLEMPNVLRLMLAEYVDGEATKQVAQLETNLDDMNPQVYEFLLARLFEAGALDAFITPVYMKKNRPGCMLTVLAAVGRERVFTDILLAETTTLGVRTRTVQRTCLEREVRLIETSLGTVRVKIARRGDSMLRAQPEYEDCRRIATETGLPLLEVMQRLQEEARRVL